MLKDDKGGVEGIVLVPRAALLVREAPELHGDESEAYERLVRE